ncbi:MAG: hypothetical protein LUD07_11305 [Clostridiales bacterium]|nr:hypothetical protein [Clostridiales bacterium]
MVVENFDVYYWIDEVSVTVWVTGIIYQGQDQIAALRRMPKRNEMG